MKYYIGDIETYIGEAMISTTVRFRTNEHPDEYLDALASDFWGEDGVQIGDGTVSIYEFGDKNASAGRWQEVDAKTFKKLTIIVELHK
jgi:hypothetical protein